MTNERNSIRIITLPAVTVASCQFIGENPEMVTGEMLDKFVLDADLPRIKPDLRHFGFNAPNPIDASGYHGYERWVTIPDDMEVPAPLTKKCFNGGTFAALKIVMGDFDEWGRLNEWVQNNPDYEANIVCRDGGYVDGLLEEHLDYANYVAVEGADVAELDLLYAIKAKA